MADDITKFKAARKTLRQSVSKIINILESEVKEKTFDNNIVEENLCLLKKKETELKIVNDKILDCFKGDEAEIEKECDTVIEYNEKICLCIFRVNKKLNLNSQVNVENQSTSGHTVNKKDENRTSIRLPKISIPKYYGDPSLFLEFYTSFENAIGNNTELTKVEKFTYLKSLLGGPALSAISGFSMSNENYDECLKLIKERFGRTDLVISSHMNKLLNLEPVKSSSNIKALRTLYDSCEINIRSLNSLGIVSDSYGSLLGPVILKLLPDDMNLEFNKKRSSKQQYNITELLDFIRLEVESREASNLIINSKKKETNYGVRQTKGNYLNGTNVPTASALTTVYKPYCFYCKSNTHDVRKCEKTNEQKRTILKIHGRCYKCFKKGHVSVKCAVKIPPCELCGGLNHNKLFCKSNIPESEPVTEGNQNTVASLSLNSKTIFENIDKVVYLQTCSVFASDKSKTRCQLVRILIDGGSQKSFIRSDFAKKLNLEPLRKEKLYIYSFGYTQGRLMEYDVVHVNLKSTHYPNDEITIEALVTDTISGAVIKVPSKKVLQMLKLENLKLADNGKTEEIQILLGSDICWEVQTGEKKKLCKNLFAVSTMFGWSLVGSFGDNQSCVSMLTIGASHSSREENSSIEDCLKKFWTLDNMGLGENENKNDKSIIEQFEKDLHFCNGRYVARLLWKENHEDLGNNLENAKRRLMSLANRLRNDEWLKENYDSIINEQLKSAIIEECELGNIESNKMYYMPHSPVVRKHASKTKVRIVFDASSKCGNEVSLNHCLIPGPNLNPSVLDLILRFRQFKYAFSADIEKAFLQISISETDRDVLRFLYFDDNFNVKHYRMTRVPFGVSCSPFILACTIKNHIKKIKLEMPDVFEMLNNSIYVDDIFYGSDTVEHAFKLSTGAHNVLIEAGMNLRQYNTNSEELKKLWDDSGIIQSEIEPNNSLKVLGLKWCTSTDVISLNIDNLCETLNNCRDITKRNILKVTATIFDPVGFLSPFVLRAKLLMQNLWQLGLEFDDEVPFECKQLWSEWCGEIETLRKFEIPREYFPGELNKDKELHLFCDASIKAYGAVAYFRSVKNGETVFIMAKSRIAPIKQKLTLPRLELSGALTAAKLAKHLQKLFSLPDENIYLWSDSMIVIHWIQSSPERWKMFVKNRVVTIHSLTNRRSWNHCSGKDNPADLLSRGCSAEYLLSSKLWRSGPDWLTEPKTSWPKKFSSSAKISDSELEMKKSVTHISILPSLVVKSDNLLKLENYSKLSRAVRVTGWIFRYIRNLQNKNDRRSGPLTAEELFTAELHLIKEVQSEHFSDEIKTIKSGLLIPKSSKLYELNPFLSEEGLLRLGGRLQKSSLSYHERHPIIIPSKLHFTDLLIRDAHERVLHTGVSNTLRFLRQKFWIIRSRQNVKRVIKKCVICQRFNSRPMQQAMAPLPASRIEQTDPFDVIGLDYAGPLFVKNDDTKYYILLFTCAVTRGIHLELTKDLTAKSFLLAFRRFVSRRGLCSVIYSDNARTFKAADAELKKMWQVLNNPDVKNYYSAKGIQWRYIVERGAWWGGFYERLVRSVKTILRKILGRTSLVVEELETVLTEIESVINHRPLTSIQGDDSIVLSPAHFLIGKKLTNLPPVKYSDHKSSSTKEILLKTYRYREKLLNTFWKIFFKDYLLNLKSVNCVKNHEAKVDLNVNDIVIIHDEHLPRNMWRLGKVIKTFTGRDGLIRSCEVKTEKGIIKRPLQLLVKLES